MIGARLVRQDFPAMGTACSAAVTAGRTDARGARRALAAARREVEDCERVLSRFRPESDLSRLNGAGGEWVAVDERLLEALRTALRLREDTEGRFEPGILPALAAAGYDRSFELLDEHPAAWARGWHPSAAIEIDSAAGRARIEPGTGVDLGGIGKGFAAARALWAMREAWLELPGGLVDLGGDIAVWGVPPEGGRWLLVIEDPRQPGSRLATLGVEAGSVATSGRDRRRFGPGRSLHHLIDPATGRPAEPGPLAVTVVGPIAAEADAYATVLAITPIAEACRLLAVRPELSALLVPVAGEPRLIGDLPLATDTRLAEVFA